jgi:protein TonB
MDSVGNILAERQADRLPWGPATVLALVLHAAVLGGLLFSVFAKPMNYSKPRAVAVRLLRAGSIRAPQVQAPPSAAPPAAAERPKIEKPVEEEPKPSKDALLLPSKDTTKKKPTPPLVSRPGRAPATPAVNLPSAEDEIPGTSAGQAAGAGGSTGIGGLKVDQPDFKFAYYTDGLRKIISGFWYRYPPIHKPANPVVHFRILRDGTITDIQLVTSSGLAFVDRNAMRAIYDASPLPPLPADYAGPHLGIQVVFE